MVKIIDEYGKTCVVSKSTWIAIKEFQETDRHLQEEFNRFCSKLIKETDEQVMGNVFYNWKKVAEDYPKYKKSIQVIAKNGLSNILEVDCLRDGSLGRLAVLFQLSNYKRYL